MCERQLKVDFAQHFADAQPPRAGYEEASFADVYASLKLAVDYLPSIPAERLAERSMRLVPTFFDSAKGLPAEDYAAIIVMPDFYFHFTVAYAILRHNGVPLGKSDLVGKYKSVPLK